MPLSHDCQFSLTHSLNLSRGTITEQIVGDLIDQLEDSIVEIGSLSSVAAAHQTALVEALAGDYANLSLCVSNNSDPVNTVNNNNSTSNNTTTTTTNNNGTVIFFPNGTFVAADDDSANATLATAAAAPLQLSTTAITESPPKTPTVLDKAFGYWNETPPSTDYTLTSTNAILQYTSTFAGPFLDRLVHQSDSRLSLSQSIVIFGSFVVVTFVLVIGVLLAWFDTGGMFQPVLNKVFVPFFGFQVALAWTIGSFLLVAATVNADFCSGGSPPNPDDTVVRVAWLESNGDPFITDVVEYYVNVSERENCIWTLDDVVVAVVVVVLVVDNGIVVVTTNPSKPHFFCTASLSLSLSLSTHTHSNVSMTIPFKSWLPIETTCPSSCPWSSPSLRSFWTVATMDSARTPLGSLPRYKQHLSIYWPAVTQHSMLPIAVASVRFMSMPPTTEHAIRLFGG